MIFVGGNPVGYGLPERAGLLKKGYRQASFLIETVCKVNTDSNTSSSNYWSSTESSYGGAFDVYDGRVYGSFKNEGYRVRFSLAF